MKRIGKHAKHFSSKLQFYFRIFWSIFFANIYSEVFRMKFFPPIEKKIRRGKIIRNLSLFLYICPFLIYFKVKWNLKEFKIRLCFYWSTFVISTDTISKILYLKSQWFLIELLCSNSVIKSYQISDFHIFRQWIKIQNLISCTSSSHKKE